MVKKISINEDYNKDIFDKDEIIKTIFTKEVLNKSNAENIIVRNALFSCSTNTDWNKVYYIMLKWMPELKIKYPESVEDLDNSYI